MCLCYKKNSIINYNNNLPHFKIQFGHLSQSSSTRMKYHTTEWNTIPPYHGDKSWWPQAFGTRLTCLCVSACWSGRSAWCYCTGTDDAQQENSSTTRILFACTFDTSCQSKCISKLVLLYRSPGVQTLRVLSTQSILCMSKYKVHPHRSPLLWCTTSFQYLNASFFLYLQVATLVCEWFLPHDVCSRRPNR